MQSSWAWARYHGVFEDGRMLGLHYQWGKSMIFFQRPHPAMAPLHQRVQIGDDFAHSQWWDMLAGLSGLDADGSAGYTGFGTGEWSYSLGCEKPEVPCKERTFYEWDAISYYFRDAWAEAFAL